MRPKWQGETGKAAIEKARVIISAMPDHKQSDRIIRDAGRDYFAANQETIGRNLGIIKLDKEQVK